MNKKYLWVLFVLIIVFSPLAGNVFGAQIVIPDSRRITWQGNVGVPGGITNWATNCITAACNALYGGSVSHTTINAALASAPNNTVVRIPAGTYAITGSINPTRGNVVLRGAGIGQTILRPTIAYAITTNSFGFGCGFGGAISSGSTKGSANIVVTNVSQTDVGHGIIISQNDEPFMFSRDANNEGTMLKHIAIVTNKTGNTLTIDPPLPWDFDASPTWLGSCYANMYQNLGFEDFTIDMVNGPTDAYAVMQLSGLYGGWIKNVEIDMQSSQFGVQIINSARMTIQGNYLHDNTTYNEGYAIVLFGAGAGQGNSGNLIENNRISNVFIGIQHDNGTGNVIAYNYIKDPHTHDANFSYQTPGIATSHSFAGMMNLYEGNHTNKLGTDGYHGSDSHATIFRNRLDGMHSMYTGYRRPIELMRWARYYNVIGNILGSPTWNPTAYEATSGTLLASNSYIYKFGYPSSGMEGYNDAKGVDCHLDPDICGRDLEVKATLLRHRNYDYFNKTIRSCTDEAEGCQGAAGNDLPDSLYLSAKPSWWCNESNWPPVDPSNPAASGSDIPAKRAFDGLSCTLGERMPDSTPPVAPTGLSILAMMLLNKVTTPWIILGLIMATIALFITIFLIKHSGNDKAKM